MKLGHIFSVSFSGILLNAGSLFREALWRETFDSSRTAGSQRPRALINHLRGESITPASGASEVSSGFIVKTEKKKTTNCC